MMDQRNQPLAVVVAHHRKGKSFSQDETLLLKLFSEVAGEIFHMAKRCSLSMDRNSKLSTQLQDARLQCNELKDVQAVAKGIAKCDDCLMLMWSGVDRTELRPITRSSLPGRFFNGLQKVIENGQPCVVRASELLQMHRRHRQT